MLWSNQTQSARMSVLYITIGALIDVWTAAYYFLIMRPEAAANPNAASSSGWFWVAGFFFSGLALFIIGLFLGQIGRAAGKAEVAPTAAGPIPTQPVAAENRPQPVANAPAQTVAPVG